MVVFHSKTLDLDPSLDVSSAKNKGELYEIIRRKAATNDPAYYMLPDTLRIWPWKNIISPYYRQCQAESVEWLEGFKPFSPKAQVAFNKCDFSLVSALCFPKGSHCKS